MRKHFPYTLTADEFWVIESLPGAETVDDVHRTAVCQVLVRMLNDDHETGLDLLTAHIRTHGDEGLLEFGMAATALLAGVIQSIDRQARARGAS